MTFNNMMKKLQSIVKKHKAISILLGSIPIVAGVIWKYGQEVVPQDKTYTINLLLLLKTSLSIFYLLVASIVLNLYLIKQLSASVHETEKTILNMDDYLQPDELGGVSKHKTTEKLFCTSCLLKNIPSPVKKNKYNWVCLSKDCAAKYPDPNNPPPVKQQRVVHAGLKKDSWINRW